MTDDDFGGVDDDGSVSSEAAEAVDVTPHGSQTYKVLGELDAQAGAGVLGHNTATTGTARGVEGVTDSTARGAAGVRGSTTADNRGVVGRAYDTASNLPWLAGAEAAGVFGTSDRAEGYGTVGWSTNHHGVLGRSDAAAAAGGIFHNAAGGAALWANGFAGLTAGVTTDNNDFVVAAGSTATSNARNVVLGHPDNGVVGGVVGATISGGGQYDGTVYFGNQVTDDYGAVGGGRNNLAGDGTSGSTTAVHATVGGGAGNTAGAEEATVGGGFFNEALESNATVGGGSTNTASGFWATVGGGYDNTASGDSSTVAGGAQNTASGFRATVAGGGDNTASGDYSFATGRNAATSGYEGTFVVGDATSAAVYGQSTNEARFQMPVYAPAHNTTSARAAKTEIEDVDPLSVLEGVRSLSVSTWEFTDTDDGRHMGPMAGEFQATFGLGDDEESIASVDADGVALAALQGLADRVEELQTENDRLRERLGAVEARLDREGPAESSPADD